MKSKDEQRGSKTQRKAWLHSHVMSLRFLVSWSTTESKMADEVEAEDTEEHFETTLSDVDEGMEAEG